MASLNTLRTKFGIVLSAVIALALLAFIFSLGSDMGFSGDNNPQVGEVDGKPVNYSEYLAMYERVREMSGVTESNQEISDQMAQSAWDAIFNQMAVVPGYEELGIVMGEAERLSVINGQTPTQALYTYFADPSTGEFNVAAVSSFLASAAANNQSAQLWSEILDDAASERSAMKFVSLLRNGVYTTDLEIDAALDAANNSYSGRWVGKRYADMPDSLYSVSDREMRDFYNKNREYRYKQNPSKSVQYVEFAINPTADDEISIEAEMAQITLDFKATENPRLFAREHTRGSVGSAYMSANQMGEQEAAAVLSDEFYGPVKSNNVWVVSKAIDIITAPDSLSLRQLALSSSQSALADSLLVALNKRGADFETAVMQYSIFAQGAQNGGNLGKMSFSSIPMDFASTLAPARQGEVVKVESGDYIQLLQVYQVGKPIKYAQVASIEYAVEPSKATVDAVYNDASSFALMSQGGTSAFKSAADSLKVSTLLFTTSAADRVVRAIENSGSIATWANNAKVGTVSEIFKAGDGYVVAMVVSENNDNYRSYNQVESAIRSELLREKKFEGFAANFSASSLEDAAEQMGSEVEPFESVAFSSYYVQGMGVEPRVIGAISSVESAGSLSALVQGNSGVYMFVVDDIQSEEVQSAEAQKVRAESAQQDYIQQAVFTAMKILADVKDERGKFF